jgi:hypothetical protein
VQCDDGVPCTDDLCDESLGACQHTPCSVGVTAEGSRYLAVTPPTGLASVALKIGAAGLSCFPMYVDAGGGLTAIPVFLSSLQWGTVHVRDRSIIPGTDYAITAEAAGGEIIASASARTADWGNADGQGDVGVFDLVCVLDGLGNLFQRCTFRADDQGVGMPDGLIDLADVQAALDAFSGAAYPDPHPCGSR